MIAVIRDAIPLSIRASHAVRRRSVWLMRADLWYDDFGLPGDYSSDSTSRALPSPKVVDPIVQDHASGSAKNCREERADTSDQILNSDNNG